MQGLRVIRRILPYSSALSALAVLYVAWIFFSRWHDERARERAAAEASARSNAKIVEMYGSGKLKVLNFYATSGTIRRGEKTLLCYGVANAVTVRIEPGVEPLKPSLSRCVEVAPRVETRYTLTAEDASGNRQVRELVVGVR